jgi:phage portal protein BeeE
MGLLDRIGSRVAARQPRRRSMDSLDIDDYANFFNFAGLSYPVIQTTLGSIDRERVGMSATGAYLGSSPVFSLVAARVRAFSQVRFQWTRFNGAVPGDLFGSPDLAVLEKPWPNGTTADLLARMEVDGSLAGNSYIVQARPGMLSRLRPEFVTIILGSQMDEGHPADAPDVEVAGYLYTPPSGLQKIYFPEEVAHYAPLPNPYYHFLGMSWITPVIRELQGDTLAVEHKVRFFENAGSVNYAIKFDPNVGLEAVKAFKELAESGHRGAFNAWKTLYLGGGADVTPVGSSFKDMDYAVIQGKAESRLASAAGVPPSWVGFSEGLQGSSLNAGNFNSARRMFSDSTMQHLWTCAAGALGNIVTPSGSAGGSSLWFDSRVPFMREDAQDVATIQQAQAATLNSLISGGFTPESAVEAVTNNDLSVLVHSGMLSVQLWAPGEESAAHPEPGADSASAPTGPPAVPAPADGAQTAAKTPPPAA